MIRAGLFALVVASVSACSALELDEDLAPMPCDSDAPCEHLEDGAPTPTCRSWRCVDARCVVALDDLDHDGFVSAMCSGDSDDDCDDDLASVSPLASETANGIDDDCDGNVDDGPARFEEPRTLYSSLVPLRIASTTRSVARDSTSVVVLESGRESEFGSVRLIHPDTSERALTFVRSAMGTELSLLAREIATAQLTTATHLVAVVPDGDCRRVAVGLGTELDAPYRRIAVEFLDSAGVHFARGIPDENGNRCGSPTTPHARAPAVAWSGTTALVVWIGADAAVDRCDALASATLLVHPARITPGGIVVSPGDATRIGATDDASPAAIVALGNDAFLIAHAIDRGIEFQRVAVLPNASTEVTNLGRFDVPPGEDAPRNLRIALGTNTSSTTSFALASTGACGTSGVRIRHFEHDFTTDTLMERTLPEEHPFDDAYPTSGPEAFVFTRVPAAYHAIRSYGLGFAIRRIAPSGGFVSPASTTDFRRLPDIAQVRALDAIEAPPWAAPGLTVFAIASLSGGADVLVEQRISFP